MFIVIQFPITDARPFINEKTHKLTCPSWPFPLENEFVRYSGRVEKRMRGGIKDWSGEDVYSRSNRAIRFPELEKRRLGKENVYCRGIDHQ